MKNFAYSRISFNDRASDPTQAYYAAEGKEVGDSCLSLSIVVDFVISTSGASVCSVSFAIAYYGDGWVNRLVVRGGGNVETLVCVHPASSPYLITRALQYHPFVSVCLRIL